MEVIFEKRLELINKIKFFSRFNDEDKRTMAELATFKAFEANAFLIEQNTLNNELFFIINGSVDIVVNGQKVVNLAGGGHVLGEMSFVNFAPASASAVANTKLTAMIFDTEKINQMDDPRYFRLRMEIYHSCAEILSKRLIHTNSIAASYLKGEVWTDL